MGDKVVYPSELDLGIEQGDGRWFSEKNASLWARAFQAASLGYVVSGMKPSGGGSGVLVTAGEAVIDGRRVQTTVTEDVSVPGGDGTYYFWLRLQKTDGKVTDPPLLWTASTDVNETFADGVRIFRATRLTGSITGLDDLRRGPPGVRVGEYTGNGSDSAALTIEVYRDAIRPVGLWVWSKDPKIEATRWPNLALGSLGVDIGRYTVEHVAGETTYQRSSWASAVWEPATLTAGSTASTTIAVAAAAVGDPVVVGFTGLEGVDFARVWGHVDSAGVVEVFLENRSGGNFDPPDGAILRVHVLHAAGVVSRGVRSDFDTTSDGVLTPAIGGSKGFFVRDDAAKAGTLNKSGKLYRWLAVL